MCAGSVPTGQSGHSGAYSCHTHLLLSPLLVSKLYGGQFIIIIIIDIFIIITIIITIVISITIIVTRSYAALRAADLDWIVGPGYSSGG